MSIPPPVCEICGNPISEGAICYRCKIEPPYFSRARSYALYKDVMRTAIIEFKFNQKIRIGEYLGGLLGEFALKLNWDIDVIVPIPLSKNRLKQRGFNQSEIIAEEVSKTIRIPVIDGLKRIKETKSSIELNPKERKENIHMAFLLAEPKLKAKRVLIIDDVYTTGATVNEAAKALKERGIKEVRVLTLAREL
jgi:ComF family protein